MSENTERFIILGTGLVIGAVLMYAWDHKKMATQTAKIKSDISKAVDKAKEDTHVENHENFLKFIDWAYMNDVMHPEMYDIIASDGDTQVK